MVERGGAGVLRSSAALLILLLAGCGYALVGRGSNVPDDVRLVFLEPLENLTPRAEVEQFLGQAIADELVTRQRFSLATERAAADALLRGAVVAFNVTPVTFDSDGRAQEYEIAITARVSFVRNNEESDVLWSNDRYLFKEVYEIEDSEANFFDRENLAIEESSERFAETMVTDLLEGF